MSQVPPQQRNYRPQRNSSRALTERLVIPDEQLPHDLAPRHPLEHGSCAAHEADSEVASGLYGA